MSDAICGGVISESQHRKNVEKFGVWADAMSYVMPDAFYDVYVAHRKAGREEEATLLFKKYAVSQI